jgi:hypothetical protein
MAAPPPPGGPQHAQFSLPPITPEQQYVQQRQQAEVKREVNYLNTLDANEPFANLQDAVMRLLPFHVSARPVSCVPQMYPPARNTSSSSSMLLRCQQLLSASNSMVSTPVSQPVARSRPLAQHVCAPVSGPIHAQRPHACADRHHTLSAGLLQLFNSVDPALADLDDTPDHMGADLMASRHDAWEQLVIDKV